MKNTAQLLSIMELLRDPENGCPWDIEQDFKTIAPHTIEEAYEVADAIETGDMEGLRYELGDLLFQVVFHSHLAKEQGLFDFDAVAQAISDKLIARHPHIFGDRDDIKTADDQSTAWEEMKAKEREHKASNNGKKASVLDDVPRNLPGLLRASKLQKRAARVGFNWNDIQDVFAKLEEETAELQHEIQSQESSQERLTDELGDMFFVLCNIANSLKVNPEEALRMANSKFERRFNFVEQRLAEKNSSPEASTLEEMDALWNKAKIIEKETA